MIHGLNQWNGVAFASRLPMTDVATSFAGMPGFLKGQEGPDLPLEARAMGVTVNDVRLWSLYVPNGRALDDPHYAYKLDWLAALRADTQRWLAAHPDQPLALMGDCNVAPTRCGCRRPDLHPRRLHPRLAARARRLRRVRAAGLTDVVRPLVPEGFTYWDYKQLRFPRNEGMRIDFILGSKPFADLVTAASIHRNERKGDAPSDHVPVVVDLDLETRGRRRPADDLLRAAIPAKYPVSCKNPRRETFSRNYPPNPTTKDHGARATLEVQLFRCLLTRIGG